MKPKNAAYTQGERDGEQYATRGGELPTGAATTRDVAVWRVVRECMRLHEKADKVFKGKSATRRVTIKADQWMNSQLRPSPHRSSGRSWRS